jgi:hypothetical protein
MKIADRIEMIAALHQKFSEVVSVGNGQRRRLGRKIFHLQYNAIEVSLKTLVEHTSKHTSRSTSRVMRSNGKLSIEVRRLWEILSSINDVASFQLRFNDGPS